MIFKKGSWILCIIENMFELLCFWSKISLPLLFFQQNVVDCFWLKNINKRIKLTVYKNICRCHHLVNKSHIEKTYIDPSHPQLGLGIYLELFWLPPFFYNSIASPSWNKHTSCINKFKTQYWYILRIFSSISKKILYLIALLKLRGVKSTRSRQF